MSVGITAYREDISSGEGKDQILKLRPAMPVIVTSGYVREEDARMATELGVEDVVLKPSSVHDLARIIQTVLSRPRGQE